MKLKTPFRVSSGNHTRYAIARRAHLSSSVIVDFLKIDPKDENLEVGTL